MWCNPTNTRSKHRILLRMSIYITRRWKRLLCVYQCIRMKHPASDLQKRKAKLIIGSFHLQYSDPTTASFKLCGYSLITAPSRMNSVSCENIVFANTQHVNPNDSSRSIALELLKVCLAHYRLTLFKHIPTKFDQTSSLSFPNTQMFGPNNWQHLKSIGDVCLIYNIMFQTLRKTNKTLWNHAIKNTSTLFQILTYIYIYIGFHRHKTPWFLDTPMTVKHRIEIWGHWAAENSVKTILF